MNYDSSGGAPHDPADISPLGAELVSRLDALLGIVAAADDGGDDNRRRLRGALTRAGDEARDGDLDLDRGCARYLLLVLCNAAYWLGRWGLPPPACHVRPSFPSPSAARGVREVAPVVGVPPAPSSAAESPVVLVADRHLPYGGRGLSTLWRRLGDAGRHRRARVARPPIVARRVDALLLVWGHCRARVGLVRSAAARDHTPPTVGRPPVVRR